MACYKPVKAFRGERLSSGKRCVVFSSNLAVVPGDFNLPCGTCVGCRLERARQWAMRCMDEASLHKENSFVTLTFSPKNLVWNRSLNVDVFQKFMKRLRKSQGDKLIRYFHCGEYGSKFGRPHYHALLFGMGFPDRRFFKTTSSGEKIYTSNLLEQVWGLGYASVGDVTFGSAAYVARYHLKKVGSVVSDDHYTDLKTGEMLSPEYVTMSRGCKARGTGGLGKGWYDRYKLDMYPSDFRIIDGFKCKPARFYDGLYEVEAPEDFRKLKNNRCVNVNLADNTPERLAVKEEVKLNQIKRLSNCLED